ncbi:Imm50 family immunity protein [Roseisolibacter sp. H3M3-2]|uniref:Imm50 family immunity protein n=1 Tax=Roseisolibacter sp. H3M3-2 TaxID=3031323 RepID=UPI0023DBD14A|nr:Imm50 family immunity protein [Roseisolibacter sp. H3M3-2]MDF1501780.1 Imm50 family immunity protein [Roseisolibacter sp. H3M3-2]
MVEIENASVVTDLFGHWPNFHDAVVHTLAFRTWRSGPAALDAALWVGAYVGPADAPSDVWTACNLVLRFVDVAGVDLAGFGPQNILDELRIEAVPDGLDDLRRPIAVTFEPSVGGGLRLRCASVAVRAVHSHRRAT